MTACFANVVPRCANLDLSYGNLDVCERAGELGGGREGAIEARPLGVKRPPSPLLTQFFAVGKQN